jgi:hypothetical protein
LNPPSLAAGFLTPNLAASGNVGPGVPKFSLGVAIGVCQYFGIYAKVTTVDTGLLGAGTSIIPLIVPNPLLQGSLLSGFASMGILGPMAPLLITGLTNGLVTGWLALALIQTNHPGIGTGAGVARIVGASAVPAMIAGLSSVGMVGEGPIKTATAIGKGLDTTFAGFVQPVPIVGAASIIGGAGIGFGSVV